MNATKFEKRLQKKHGFRCKVLSFNLKLEKLPNSLKGRPKPGGLGTTTGWFDSLDDLLFRGIHRDLIMSAANATKRMRNAQRASARWKRNETQTKRERSGYGQRGQVHL